MRWIQRASLDELKLEPPILYMYPVFAIYTLSHHIPILAVYHLRIAQWNLQTQITFELHVVEKQFHQEYLFPRYLTYLKQVYGAHIRGGWGAWLAFLIRLNIVGKRKSRMDPWKSNVRNLHVLNVSFCGILMWKIMKVIERKQEIYFWSWLFFSSLRSDWQIFKFLVCHRVNKVECIDS